MNKKTRTGFTLIEIILVLAIIGVLVAVIVPRAWRARVDAKYSTLRQTCSELAGYANDWAERQLESRPPGSSASSLDAYMVTLTDDLGRDIMIANDDGSTGWIEDGFDVNGTDTTASVQDFVPQGKGLRNPFNGLDIFASGNAPASGDYVQGAVGCGYADDGGYNYYALIFQSTNGWYAGQGTGLEGLRSGVFIARLR